MKMAYTPTELASIIAQLRNIKVNGRAVFRIEVEPTSIQDLKRVEIHNVQTTGILEFALVRRVSGAWDGVLAKWGSEDFPCTFEEAMTIARARIGETVAGYYEGEEWVITDVMITSDNTIRAVVVDKKVHDALKELGDIPHSPADEIIY